MRIVKALALVLVLSCAGCATPGDLAKKPPTETVASNKTPQEVVECYAPAITASWPLTRVLPRPGGQTVLVSSDSFGNIAASVDAFSGSGGHTVVQFRQGAAVDRVYRDIRRTADSCL